MLRLVAFFCGWLLFLDALIPARAASIDSVQVPSAVLHRPVRAVVVRPTAYATRPEAHYPVVYLLHGFGGNEREFLIHFADPSLLGRLADKYGVLIVTPAAGTSFYLDSPQDPASQYESFMVRELLPWVAGHYRTAPGRAGRALAGFSMGGHGALYLGLRHPDLFGAASGMAAALDLAITHNYAWSYPPVRRLLGDFDPARYRQYSVVGMVEQLKASHLPVLLDCDVDDEFFIGAHRQLHQALLAAGVPHDYCERPGRHDFAYVADALEYQLLFLTRHLRP